MKALLQSMKEKVQFEARLDADMSAEQRQAFIEGTDALHAALLAEMSEGSSADGES